MSESVGIDGGYNHQESFWKDPLAGNLKVKSPASGVEFVQQPYAPNTVPSPPSPLTTSTPMLLPTRPYGQAFSFDQQAPQRVASSTNLDLVDAIGSELALVINSLDLNAQAKAKAQPQGQARTVPPGFQGPGESFLPHAALTSSPQHPPSWIAAQQTRLPYEHYPSRSSSNRQGETDNEKSMQDRNGLIIQQGQENNGANHSKVSLQLLGRSQSSQGQVQGGGHHHRGSEGREGGEVRYLDESWTAVLNSPSGAELMKFLTDSESRAIILWNIESVPEEDLRSACEVYGPVYYLHTDFRQKRVAFLAYYDIRHAVRAHQSLGRDLSRLSYRNSSGPPPAAHFSVMLHAGSSFKEGNLVVHDIPRDVTEADVYRVFQRYGDLRGVSKQIAMRAGGHQVCFCVDFHNIQDAKAAAHELTGNNPWATCITIEPAARSEKEKSLGRQLATTLSCWIADAQQASAAAHAAAVMFAEQHAANGRGQFGREERMCSLSSVSAVLSQRSSDDGSPPPSVEEGHQEVKYGVFDNFSPLTSANTTPATTPGCTPPSGAEAYQYMLGSHSGSSQHGQGRELSPEPVHSPRQHPLHHVSGVFTHHHTTSAHMHLRAGGAILQHRQSSDSSSVSQPFHGGWSLQGSGSGNSNTEREGPGSTVMHGSSPGPPGARQMYPSHRSHEHIQQTHNGMQVHHHVHVSPPLHAQTPKPLQHSAHSSNGASMLGSLGQSAVSDGGTGSMYGSSPGGYYVKLSSGNYHNSNSNRSCDGSGAVGGGSGSFRGGMGDRDMRSEQSPSTPVFLSSSSGASLCSSSLCGLDCSGAGRVGPGGAGELGYADRGRCSSAAEEGVMHLRVMGQRVHSRDGGSLTSPGSRGGGNGGDEFSLDLKKVAKGLDKRTTIMIRNIPNKYTQAMLLAEIDANYRESYDFFYLPIDFKNKCNVGYAFINFMDYRRIVPFSREFNAQRWKNFNSEKVCAISYARIQGKASMISRFQNSSLMEKDGEYRPLIFYSNGLERGRPEPFPAGSKPKSGGGVMKERDGRLCSNASTMTV